MRPFSSGVYFVSGIDTDAGKSYATGLLARRLAEEQGVRVITQKFVQTGNTGLSEDIELHRRLMGIPLQEVDLDGTTAPLIYRFPASPHLAAALEGRAVETARIDASTERLRGLYDIVLVEGAGGLAVPLAPFPAAAERGREYLTMDYVAERRLPLLFVTSAKLGSLNHTLLSFEACRARGIEVAGVLWNLCPAGDPVIAADTRAYIADYLRVYWPSAQLIDIPAL
ncbi:dethiobiotin synthase [uncultured Rikenella sp.]|uniref:dethiobiotin synthase n=1 Tax=uncultured Rikenella sp. TaxID=368003 RepID=UPI002613C375|nr:dethiobiotin synthase [uncultured Rikenella sp.]